MDKAARRLAPDGRRPATPNSKKTTNADTLPTPLSLLEQTVDSMRWAKEIAERKHDGEAHPLVAAPMSTPSSC